MKGATFLYAASYDGPSQKLVERLMWQIKNSSIYSSEAFTDGTTLFKRNGDQNASGQQTSLARNFDALTSGAQISKGHFSRRRI